MRKGPAPRPLKERFWEKVSIRGKNECWPFTGPCRPYGQFWYDGNVRGAHTIAFMLTRGKRAKGPVCHTCHYEPCCNPNHLYDGTHSSNALDSVRDGRWARQDGIYNGIAKFTEEQVREMRELYPTLTYQAIADLFGCSLSVAWNIITKNSYKEVMP